MISKFDYKLDGQWWLMMVNDGEWWEMMVKDGEK